MKHYEFIKRQISAGVSVTDDGLIVGLRGNIIKSTTTNCGYLKHTMYDKISKSNINISAHHVAFVYFYGINCFEVNHVDGNKHNNRKENLEASDPSHNKKHAYSIGLMDMKGELHPGAILKSRDIPQIINFRSNGFTMKQIGTFFGVNRKTIADILNNKTWTHVER